MTNLNFVTIYGKLGMSVIRPSRLIKHRVGHSRLSREVRVRVIGKERAFAATEELHGII